MSRFGLRTLSVSHISDHPKWGSLLPFSSEIMRQTTLLSLCAAVLLVACGTENGDSPRDISGNGQQAFWASLQTLCGQAFAGTLVEMTPPDTSFVGKEFVMHVRQCEDSVVRIPFFVGDDRSRTWVISRTPTRLRLKHDHRHEDGTEDEVTQYGGDTSEPGGARRQEFAADAHTASLIPAAATNVWTLEIQAGESFTYALRREGTDRRFRVKFDLTRTVPAPPPPWGN